MTKIGIIGIGTWGSNHANVLSNLNSLCCVYDEDLSRSKNIAEHYNVKPVQNIDEMLESDVDGIVLATPAATHSQIAVKILNAGKGVLIEKPLAISMDQALTVKKAIDSGGKLAIGYEERFNPAVISLINCLKGKDNISISLYRIGSRPERIKDVGVVLDTMIHDINIANYLLGPLEVSSVWSTTDINGREIFVTATLDGKRGTAHLVASWISKEKLRMGIGISPDAIVSSDFMKQDSKCLLGGKEVANTLDKIDLLKAEDESFINYLNGKGQFPIGINDAMEDLSIAFDILNQIGVNRS